MLIYRSRYDVTPSLVRDGVTLGQCSVLWSYLPIDNRGSIDISARLWKVKQISDDWPCAGGDSSKGQQFHHGERTSADRDQLH